jgi:hypothetical protein
MVSSAATASVESVMIFFIVFIIFSQGKDRYRKGDRLKILSKEIEK